MRDVTLPEGLAESIDAFARSCHANSSNHGFWDDSVTPIVRKLLDAAKKAGFAGLERREVEEAAAFVRQREQDSGSNHGEKIALMHSELSEALEAMREPEMPESAKIPGFTQVEEELADLLIRVGDYAGRFELNLGAAVAAKHAYNVGRPIRHGKAF